MDSTKEFMHLPFPLKENGKPFFRRPMVEPPSLTEQYRQSRQSHGSNLKRQAKELSTMWNARRNERKQQNLPEIKGGIPFLLQMDPTVDVDFLYGLGFEVVCDLDDGFIIVASDDVDLNVFQRKLDNFIGNKQRSGSPAKIYGMGSEEDRLSKILSKSLFEKWTTLDEVTDYIVDLSIECNGLTHNYELPKKIVEESDSAYDERCKKTQIEYAKAIDNIARERQQQFERIVTEYNNRQQFEYIDGVDSFSVRITICGKGLRDLVQNFGYIFEVSESVKIEMETAIGVVSQIEDTLSIIEPIPGSPIVCVIDSGIQENHRYLSSAILSSESVCLIHGETSVNDEYGKDGTTGGHGTRVAGAVLYHNDIPLSGSYTLPCFIRNVRILDSNNQLPIDANPSQTISEVIKRFVVDTSAKSKIFNHSIGEIRPFDGEEFKHMSTWAAKIDEVSYKEDVLFIQPSGNITQEVISGLIGIGFGYPQYFCEKPARLSNPAQSLQALTVGSISHTDFDNVDFTAMGKKGEVSSFSRIGPGIWDSIKPDVVEYGGTYAINKHDNTLVTPIEVCTDLIRSSPQGPAHAKDNIGTSFAAPKVAHIAAVIQQVLPNAPALLYRALIVQSARLPGDVSLLTTDEKQMLMRQMGYGLPDVEKAVRDNNYRATFVTTESVEIAVGEAHIYPIHIPEILQNIGEDYNILVEVTLSYSAMPRRTRRYINGYMSTWLDWICSRKGESEETFKQRVFETDKSIQDDGAFGWTVREQNNWGEFKGFNRKGQTIQKDWCIIKSSQLTDAFCVAVRGHKGWGSLFKAKYALAVSFEAIDQNIEIYEPIRLCNQIEIETMVENQEINVNVDLGGEVV
ncbi:hypothetical protein R80B4_00465 [Fibrobacteres bacterium R8-0-B4]